ncbi:MAG TPA: hypothetical protein VHP33_14345 [Polyangiaceae bacterium]|nr:hypothetical protein [Polyangiaceae bacterium]
MTALGPGEIRARRRPGLVVGVAGLRLLMGLCLAWPLSSLLAASGVGLRPEGDRLLFEGGGYLLLDVLRQRGSELEAVARGLLPVLGLGLLFTAACNAALLVGLNQAPSAPLRGRLQLRELLGRASERVPAMIVLGVGTALGQLLLILGGSLTVAAVPESLAEPVKTTVTQLAIWSAVAIAAGGVGGFSDLVKASLVRHDSRLVDALAHAWACLLRRPIRASFGWFPYALAFLLAAFLAARLSELVDVSQPGAWRVAMVFAVHQLVVVTSVAARSAWYARALRIVATHA